LLRPLDLALITTFENFPSSDGRHGAERTGCKVLYDPTPVPCVHVTCDPWRGALSLDPSGGLRKDGSPGKGGAARGNRRKLYQVNLWLWSFGRPIPRLESVADAEERRAEGWLQMGTAIRDARQKQAWPRRRGNCQHGQVRLWVNL
jgi:hypothetical protein